MRQQLKPWEISRSFSALPGNPLLPIRRTKCLETLLPSQVYTPPRLGQTPEFNCLPWIWERQRSWVNCIARDRSELPPQPPNGRAWNSRNSWRDIPKRKGKGSYKTRLSFPISPLPRPHLRPGAPCRLPSQQVFSTCCRWRRTSVAVSQGTTLARKELGSAFCAS